MNILAIDQALHTGWASLKDGHVESGSIEFKAERSESRGIRFLKFRKWLNQMIDLVKPEIVVYEQTHQRGGAATELAYGFTTRIQERCSELNIEYTAIHSGTLKKFITGKGSASKLDMIKTAEKMYGKELYGDDDEADALCLLAYGRAKFNEGEQDEMS